MVYSGTTRMFGGAALAVLASALLPACSGCQVDIERGSATHADGLFSGILVGGTEPDGPFVVARRERAPGDDELVFVSLAEGERRTCSLGKAALYTTSQPQAGFGNEEPRVDARPARILTIEGELGDESGDLRVFDASCTERVRVPSVAVAVWPKPTLSWVYDESREFVGYVVRTTSGEIVTIDPWAGSVQTIAKGVSSWRHMQNQFWLIEGGSLVVRDRDGKLVQAAGAGVTEFAIGSSGADVAYVDEKGLWVLKLGEDAPTAIPTPAAPCKLEYLYSPPSLAYHEDCAAGVLAVRAWQTGEKRVFSSGVTYVDSLRLQESPWLFFEREESGKKRELWAVPEGGEPVLVGTDSRLDLGLRSHGDGFLLTLDHDGTAGTLGKWKPEGGFSPLVEGIAGAAGGGSFTGYLAAVADAQEEVGTLVVFDGKTLVEKLRVPRVHHDTPRFSWQAPALGYVRDWDAALGAGTLEAWIPFNGQQVEVDTGVAEFDEVFWPEPGIVYAVRTPERAGLWTAYPDL